jgi:hypothetical protein
LQADHGDERVRLHERDEAFHATRCRTVTLKCNKAQGVELRKYVAQGLRKEALLRRPAPVDRDRRAGDVVGHRRAEPQRQRADLRRVGGAARRLFLGQQVGDARSRSPPWAAARAAICGSMIAVSVQPGQMQLTVTPPFALSPAAAYSSAATG